MSARALGEAIASGAALLFIVVLGLGFLIGLAQPYPTCPYAEPPYDTQPCEVEYLR